ncbi:MAG: rhodanese-like domain-containing protein [Betaproteobacteria bacterium]
MTSPQSELAEILLRAGQRGSAANLSYAGAVTPQEAFSLYRDHGAKIVDVRSSFENQFIGRIPGSKLVSWKFWPSGATNSNFLTELNSVCTAGDTVLFLCRSGVRSDATAKVAAAAGYSRAFNILEGFEGDLDKKGQRGNIGGWRKAGLPWVQD